MTAYTSIKRTLDKGQKLHRKAISHKVIMVLTLCWFCIYPLLLWADMLQPLAEGTRQILGYVWALGWPTLLIVWIFFRTLYHKNEHAIAQDLEQRDPHLGSSLTNGLYFLDQIKKSEQPEKTRELSQMALDQYGERLDQWSDETAKQSLLKHKLYHLPLFGVLFALLPMLWGWQVFLNESLRFFDPKGFHPPYSNTQLKITSPEKDPALVIYGKHLTVTAMWSGQAPLEVNLWIFDDKNSNTPSESLPMLDKGSLGFQQRIENISKPVWIQASAHQGRSLSPKHKIDVQMIPLLEKSLLSITPPAYTRKAPQLKEYQAHHIKVLEGSELQFTFFSNRPLQGGTALIRNHQGQTQELQLSPHEEKSVQLLVSPEEAASLSIDLMDVEGYHSGLIEMGRWSLYKDIAPEVRIAHPMSDTFVAQDFALEIKVEASDDYGLSELKVHRILNGYSSPPLKFNLEDQPLQHSFRYPINMIDLGIQGGDVIQIFAEVIDNAPNPNYAKSEMRRIQVISVEDYNRFLREQSQIQNITQKYTDLMNEFQELLDQQEQLLQELNEAIENQNSKKAEELSQKMKNLEQDFQNMSQKLEEFGRDEPLYDVEKEYQDILKNLAERLQKANQEQTQSREKTEQQSQQGSISSQQAMQQMQEAIKQHREQVQASGQEANETIQTTQEDLALMQNLMQDFNMVQTLYQAQMAIAEQTKAYSEIENPDRATKLALHDLATEQADISTLLAGLKDNLERHAEEAQYTFPKAAKSARDLAQTLEEKGMIHQSERATHAMRLADAPQSWQLAEHLKQDFASLFSTCQSNGQAQNELDRYLSLSMGMKPGSTYEQMKESTLLQWGGGSSSGQSGYSMNSALMRAQSMQVMGNETLSSQDQAMHQGPQNGMAEETQDGGDDLRMDKVEETHNQRRQHIDSKSVDSGGSFFQYRDVVKEYFKAVQEEEK